MKRLAAVSIGALAVVLTVVAGRTATAPETTQKGVPLPTPVTKGTMSLEEALSQRRSVRSFQTKDLSVEQVGQLLWAAQGITDEATGHRTAPSAMAVYPLTVYMLTDDGVFSYQPKGHRLHSIVLQDRRPDLAKVTQRPVEQAPVTFVITGDPSKMSGRFAALAERFITLEAGHAAQNLALEATALGLGTVTMGGFDGAAVSKLLELPAGVSAIYVMPVGYPAAR